jgi:hypothetical protein
MGNDLLEELRAIDLATLTDVVRQDQNNPSFEISEWKVKQLSDKGIANPNGLWLFYGRGNNGRESCSWSVVLKIVGRQEEQLPASDLWYWKREYLLVLSNLTEDGIIKVPRFYRCEETADRAWIWMEYVVDLHPGKWTLDEYAFAARQFGLWNSIYLTGKSLPTEDWLARRHYRSWLGDMNAENALTFSLIQQHFSEDVRTHYLALWNEREQFFQVLERLPEVFSHFDSQRRNLLIRKNDNKQDELVVLDWQQCGIGAVGAELNWMIGLGGVLLEWSPSEMVALDKIVFQSYMRGLREGGWAGDVDIVRLGYVAMLSVYIGCAFPDLIAFWCSPENRDRATQALGLAEEDLFLETLPMFHYALDCVDEARSLMKKLTLI